MAISTSNPALPLAGYRVLSLAEQYPGPFATLILSDLGADVVQLERPGGGDPSRRYPAFHSALNRGKRSAALDLKRPEGVAAARRVAGQADVLLEGFRPGVADRLGLGPAELTATDPGLVYVSVSGFGQTGPYRDRPAHDLSYQAMAGMLEPSIGDDRLPALSLADLTAGLFAAIAALTGLAGRYGRSGRGGRGGRGGVYDVSMFDSLVSLMTTRLVPVANGAPGETLGQDPGYGCYGTGDGRWLTLSIAFEDHFWRRLCAALDLPRHAELTGIERVTRRAELRADLASVIGARPLAVWEAVLAGADVPFGAVRTPAELLGDRHLHARGLLHGVGGELHLRQPLMVDGTAPGPRTGCPAVGADTREILAAAGLGTDEIDTLLRAGVAAEHPRPVAP